jgi:hypothetical protein
MYDAFYIGFYVFGAVVIKGIAIAYSARVILDILELSTKS